MWFLLLSAAHATELTCDPGDTLYNILGIARRDPGPVVILLDPACAIDVETVDIYPGSGGGTEFTLKPAETSGTFTLPPIAATEGVLLHLERIVVETTAPQAVDTVLEEVLGAAPGMAIYVNGAELDFQDVSLVGADGAGMVVVDGVVTGTGLTARGFDVLRPFYAIAASTDVTVDLTDLEFSQNGAGGVALWGAGADVGATFDSLVFRDNGPAAAADIGAIDVANLQVTDAAFGDSVAVDDAVMVGAPLVVDGGSLVCGNCDFTGTTGETASTIAAYLDAGDRVELQEGTYAPADASVPLMHIDSGGTFSAQLLEIVGAGDLVRYAGSTSILSTRFDADGGAPDVHAIKLVGTNAVLDGITMCDYASNGWGLIGAYGSDVELSDSVFQNLALDGDPVVRAWNTMGDVGLVIEDNTIAGSDAVLVSGAPASLTFTNNLLAETTGGLALDATPGDADIGYNLWFEVDEPVVGGGPGPNDVVDEDPRFSDVFVLSECGSGPWLDPGTPANAAGDPSRGDGYGNSRSDIGAIDYDERGEPVDTGDTSLPPDDTGVPDTALPGDDTGIPPGLVGGALPPCGCASGNVSSLSALLLGAVFIRRRAS